MKVNRIIDIGKKYTFEGVLKPATIRSGKKIYIEDYTKKIDLINLLLPKPKHCFLVTVTGESMIDKGIYEGDLLVIDKDERPANGKIVIASVNGELTLKTLRILKEGTYLEAANRNFPPIKLYSMDDVQIQGVVKHVIHSL